MREQSPQAERELRRAFQELKSCHADLHKEFSRISGSVYRQYLGKFDSKLRTQVKKYCDGHVLYSVPKTVREMKLVDVCVPFAVTSPKLSESSNFDPFTPLHEIEYWRLGRGLTPSIRSASDRHYRLHFMAWQQNFAIHGVGDAHARRNRRLLLQARPNLKCLFEREHGASSGFLMSYARWLILNGRIVFLVTESSRETFYEPISTLKNEPSVIQIRTKLRGVNRKIMRSIAGRLG